MSSWLTSGNTEVKENYERRIYQERANKSPVRNGAKQL